MATQKVARNKEMLRLRVEENRTLKEIGKMFGGISRQRVAQVLGETGRLPKSPPKYVYKPRFLNNGLGTRYEKMVYDTLTAAGFRCEMMPMRHPFDILVDGKIKVDVKGTAGLTKVNGYGYHRFALKADKKNECDFFVCVAVDRLLVIPMRDVVGKKQILIRPDAPSKYDNRLDFLRAL